MVNPLDPSRPVLGDPVEITEELRAIKSRLVSDKAGIESLQSTVVAISDPGIFGLPLLGTDTLTEALDLLDAGTTGRAVFAAETVGAIQALLSISNPNATVSAGAGKTCITLPGGVKINCMMGDFADGSSHTWQTPFTTVIFGIAAVKLVDENGSFQVYSENNAGFSVSFEGSGTKRGSVIAIGI